MPRPLVTDRARLVLAGNNNAFIGPDMAFADVGKPVGETRKAVKRNNIQPRCAFGGGFHQELARALVELRRAPVCHPLLDMAGREEELASIHDHMLDTLITAKLLPVGKPDIDAVLHIVSEPFVQLGQKRPVA